jgi:tripeptidyl-peptidase-1
VATDKPGWDVMKRFGIGLTYPTPVTVYQVGDDVEGGSFNNFLDALDGSYCTYEGGDDPSEVGLPPSPIQIPSPNQS